MNSEWRRRKLVGAIVFVSIMLFPFATRAATVEWYHHGHGWKTIGGVKPPDCPRNPILKTPVKASLVTSVLYPGQIRGGEYKVHGGFRFDGFPNNNVTVMMPIEAQLVRAGRFRLLGEMQYHFEFTAPCGLHFWFGHILKPSPKLKAIVDKLPIPPDNTTKFKDYEHPVTLKLGEVVATAVGFKKDTNVFFDFGLLNIRHPNAESKFRKYYLLPQFDRYAACMFNFFKPADAAYLKQLPAGDSTSGKKSIYCH